MQRVGWFFLLIVLCSCNQAALPSATPLPTPRITPSLSGAAVGATPTLVPSFAPTAPRPTESLYSDPQGWYSIRIPSEWQNTAGSAKDGSFETGYLPEMMFMRSEMDVCQWLANITIPNTYSISWPGTHPNSCQLISLPGAASAGVLEVIENPSADFAQRFLYIKADAAHFNQIASTLRWLRPVDEKAKPAFHTGTLRLEDTSFWKNTAPLPPGFTVTEYKLPPEAQTASPEKKIFGEYIPPEARPTQRPVVIYPANSLEKVNGIIAHYGYELQAEGYLYHLYQGGAPRLKNLYRLPEVYRFPTTGAEQLVFFAYTTRDPEQPYYARDNADIYLIQNETISLWQNGPLNPMGSGDKPIWAAGQLLVLGVGDHVNLQVRNSQHNLVFSFETYFGTHIPIERFQAWDKHWTLEVSDFVVQDGEILNAKFGFEEIFDSHQIAGQPFFFFRKGPRVGISYAGQFLAVYYHEVMHGYCCGLALNNPMIIENTIRFLGEREGVWYYVVIEIK
jgi:hypothetical protein